MFGKPHKLFDGLENTGNVWRLVNKRYKALALCLILSACGGASDGNGGNSISNSIADDGFVLPLSVVENDTNTAGSVDWDRLVESELNEIEVIIQEDTALVLVVGSEASTGSVVISSFPEFGAGVIVGDRFEYTPNLNFFGEDRIRVIRDSIEYVFIVNVMPVNDAPVIIDDIDRVAEQGVFYSSLLRVRNVDQDQLSFSSDNLPTWLNLNRETGVLSGLPEQQDVGLHGGIRLVVRDAGGLEDVLENIRIEVLDLNDAPTLNITQFPSRLDARESVTVNVFPDDIDGDAVSLEVQLNDFVESSVNGGAVTVTALDINEVTQINLVLRAIDQLGNDSRAVVPLTLFPLTESGRGRTLQRKKAGSGIHLVVLGDGYREDQQEQFRTDVEALIRTMEEDPAVALHLSAWNIHMIETPSVDSGIDDNVAVNVRDTVFDTGYFCLGVARLICGDNRTMFDVALDEFPDLDELVLLVNDSRFGGSGGSVAVASSSAPEIALHEMGHSLANLADEYVDNSIPDTIPTLNITEFREGVFANISTLQDPARVPWSAWIDMNNSIPSQPGENGVGVFQGGYYQPDVYFRPTFDSRMRTFNRPFGVVNGEAWALSVYRETQPVATFSPRTNSVSFTAGESASFRVEPIFGPDIQRLVWTLNGVLLTDQVNDTEINLSLETGRHQLTLNVTDITGAIRKTPPHSAQFFWQWDITVQ